MSVIGSKLVNRARDPAVALETTLLVHGVPKDQGSRLALQLQEIARSAGAHPAVVGVVDGVPIVGINDHELGTLLNSEHVPKVNTSNLGLVIHRRLHGATTVSATMELAAVANVRVFATGGLGGLHRNLESHLDISADLGAIARFPVAIVTSGVKSLLDVVGTRELLETLGIPVIGYKTEEFPAFYSRSSGARVDARFDDVGELASFVAFELQRAGRGIVIANPIPVDAELDNKELAAWIDEAHAQAMRSKVSDRSVTPFILGRLHDLSEGATLRANLRLAQTNTQLAAELAVALSRVQG